MTPPLLEVRDLTVSFGATVAVDHISFNLQAGETLGLVGESGCGKSTTAMALMRLLHGARTSGRAELSGRDLLTLDDRTMQALRGAEVAMIFQDPMTALHPLIRAGEQVAEAIRAHRDISRSEAMRQALALFHKVGIAAPEQRLRAFPHELSGGMCQRVMIAAAIACGPRLLLADEPTTALDVTVQAQILELIRDVCLDSGTAVILITHDLGVVAGQADRVAVMYAGRIVEQAPTLALYARPAHPYTRGLLGSVPSLVDGFDDDLPTIPGSVATVAAEGCRFAPRCPLAIAQCREVPPLAPVADDHFAACWRAG